MSTAALYQTIRGVNALADQAATTFADLVERLADNTPVDPATVADALRRAGKTTADLEHAVDRLLRRRELAEVAATKPARNAELIRLGEELAALEHERRAALERLDERHRGLLDLHRAAIASYGEAERAEQELQRPDLAGAAR